MEDEEGNSGNHLPGAGMNVQETNEYYEEFYDQAGDYDLEEKPDSEMQQPPQQSIMN